MSFTTAGRPFGLATVHVVWGDHAALPARALEAEALAKMLRRTVKGRARVSRTTSSAPALVANGLQPDADTIDKPRTMKDRPGSKIAYDRLAWFREGDGKLTFKRLACETFPWNEHVLVGAAGDTSSGSPTTTRSGSSSPCASRCRPRQSSPSARQTPSLVASCRDL